MVANPDSIAWCEARMLVPGNPLTLTLPYADPQLRDGLLSLRTVIAEIGAVPGTVGEPEVAIRKLGWWRQALADHLPHPAISALVESGAIGQVAMEDFDALISAVEGTVSGPRFERREELWGHCDSLGGQAARMEAGLVAGGADPSSAALGNAGAAGYLVRLVRDLVVDARSHRWLVPLDLQAEYQLNRAEVAAGGGGRRLHGLVRALLEMAVRGGLQGVQSLSPETAWRHRHQLLCSEVELALARRLARSPGRVVNERLAAGSLMTGIRVWRRARKLGRDRRRALG